jgi:hypothetical protein
VQLHKTLHIKYSFSSLEASTVFCSFERLQYFDLYRSTSTMSTASWLECMEKSGNRRGFNCQLWAAICWGNGRCYSRKYKFSRVSQVPVAEAGDVDAATGTMTYTCLARLSPNMVKMCYVFCLFFFRRPFNVVDGRRRLVHVSRSACLNGNMSSFCRCPCQPSVATWLLRCRFPNQSEVTWRTLPPPRLAVHAVWFNALPFYGKQ